MFNSYSSMWNMYFCNPNESKGSILQIQHFIFISFRQTKISFCTRCIGTILVPLKWRVLGLNVEIAISRLANSRNEDFKVFWSFCHCLEQVLLTERKYITNKHDVFKHPFFKHNQKQNWPVHTYCKLQWCSFLNICLSIIISWHIPF